jgi:hypothetical protein
MGTGEKMLASKLVKPLPSKTLRNCEWLVQDMSLHCTVRESSEQPYRVVSELSPKNRLIGRVGRELPPKRLRA